MGTVEKVTSADGTSIAVEREGDGPALVLVDAAGSFRGFGPMGALPGALAPEFTVVTYDRRGRGESADTAPYSVDKEVDDLRAVIEAAGGSAFVYGFSSGAVLALHAAACRLPITKLALLEPPLALDDEPPDPAEQDLQAEIAELIAADRRGDAIVQFNTAIGVPPEIVAGMRKAPTWPAMEALAHTLLYDMEITSSLRADALATIATPTLVINSDGSDERLAAWARGVAAALPAGQHRSLRGEWHGVPVGNLARELTGFFSHPSR